MRALCSLLLVCLLTSGCASLGWTGGTEKFVLEVVDYRMWNEVYYYTGRTKTQWLMVCKTISPAKRAMKNTNIIVTEKDVLYQCPTGTVMQCSIENRAISAWERIAKKKAPTVDLPSLRAKAEELESKATAIERSVGESEDGAYDDSEATAARQAASQARDEFGQAELFVKALVVSAADVVRFEVIKEASSN